MTPTLRNAVVLGLSLLGILILTLATREDPMAAEMVAAGGCFLLARVYAQLNPPPGGRGGWGGDRG